MGFGVVDLQMPRKVAECSRATGGHFLDPTKEYFLWWQKWRKLRICTK